MPNDLPARSDRSRSLAGRTMLLAGAAGLSLALAPLAWANVAGAEVEAKAAAAVDLTDRAAAIDSEYVVRDVLKKYPVEVTEFMSHLITLASPFMEGRGPDTQGNRIAADYIAFHFRDLGLEPPFAANESSSGLPAPLEDDGKTYQDWFDVAGALRVTAAELAFNNRTLTADDDFAVIGLGSGGEVTAPLAFVGYSVDEGPDGYTSFSTADGADDDLSGRVAVLFRWEPLNDEGTSQWREGEGYSRAAFFESKVRNLVERGAEGVILVAPPDAADPRAEDLLSSRATRTRSRVDGPAVMMTQDQADRLLRSADPDRRSLRDFRALADAGSHPVLYLRDDVDVTLNTATEREVIPTTNVAGVIPGSGALADEYVIVCGHYDHLGYGMFGSRGNVDGSSAAGVLHPGADDNASGTAAALVAARLLSERVAEMGDDGPRRSIMFLLFSAEEMGLLGAVDFVEKAYDNGTPISGDQIVAVVNLDMVGRVTNNVLEINGVATSRVWEEVFSAANEDVEFDLEMNAPPGGRSDHAIFVRRGTPAVHVFSGLTDVYHRPQDTADTINFTGGARVSMLAAKAVERLATMSQRPSFLDEDEREAEASEPRASGPASRSRVRFGIQPGNYDGDTPGLYVANVFPDTPAADAGVKPGDIIIGWQGEDVIDVAAWFQRFVQHEPGDTVNFVVLRDDRELTLKTTLTARDGG